MKHIILSTFLLIGFGMTPLMGMLGGGNMYYGKDPEIQQSAGDPDETATKDNSIGDSTRQKIAENHATGLCTGTKETSCPDPGIPIAK
jgi:hypothetical protein